MQKRISVMSNAGGTGKSTLVINIAYQLARLGQTVAIFGCDPNGSLTLFAGLADPPEAEETLDRVLRADFDGKWPLFPVWKEDIQGVDACLGGPTLIQTSKRLDQDSRGVLRLVDSLEDHPLHHDTILFDCPGTIERFHEVALCASTGVLVVSKLEDKDIDACFKLFTWVFNSQKALRIKPPPNVIGLVPNVYRKERAMQRDNLHGKDDQLGLKGVLNEMNIRLFPPIRDSAYIANAGAYGLPVGLYRPGEEVNRQFEVIARTIMEQK